MKKTIFIILSVIMLVSSGVNVQAAELPFVSDGEKTVEETTPSNREETNKVTEDDNRTSEQEDITLPVEVVEDESFSAVDNGLTTDNGKVTIDKDNPLVSVDKNGKETVNDDSQKYEQSVNENGQTKDLNDLEAVNAETKTFFTIIYIVTGAAVVVLLAVITFILVKRKRRG